MSQPLRLGIIAAVALAALAGAPFIGMQTVPLEAVLDPGGDSMESTVFWDILRDR